MYLKIIIHRKERKKESKSKRKESKKKIQIIKKIIKKNLIQKKGKNLDHNLRMIFSYQKRKHLIFKIRAI